MEPLRLWRAISATRFKTPTTPVVARPNTILMNFNISTEHNKIQSEKKILRKKR